MRSVLYSSLAVLVLAASSGCCCLDGMFCGPGGGCGLGGCGLGGCADGGCVGGGCADGGCGGAGCGGHLASMLGNHRANGGAGMTGAVTYPYYTTRGPRDFLASNPRPIGR